MPRTKTPAREDLIKKIRNEMKKNKNQDGIWIRKLARNINEPLATVYKYVTTNGNGYLGDNIIIVKKLPKEMGGNIMIRWRE